MAQLELASLFQDHMVLQRDRAITIWGWGKPSRQVKATIAGRHATTRVDARGRWLLVLAPLKTGGPYTLKVASEKTIVVRDILAGEVWVCSGQSNMQFGFAQSHRAKQDGPKARFPRIRYFTVRKAESFLPLERARGKWVVVAPSTVNAVSAVAYYFGRKIHRDLKVPVGLIVSAWGGTAAESWTPWRDMAADMETAFLTEAWSARKPEQRRILDRPQPFKLEYRNAKLIPRRGGSPRNLDDNWRTMCPTARLRRTAPDAFRFSGSPHVEASAVAFLNVRNDKSPADLSGYESVQLEVKGTGNYKILTDQPSIWDSDLYSSKPFRAKAKWQRVTIRLDSLRQDGWGIPEPFTPRTINAIMIAFAAPVWAPSLPGGLYNAMIAPLTNYSLRGAIWFQGSANAGRPNDHRALLKGLVNGWRREWGNERLHFIPGQIPNIGRLTEDVADSGWPRLQEAQRKAMEDLPFTGIAITLGLGEANNVHPRNKMDVGERMAIAALGTVYGKPVVPSGPAPRFFTREGRAIRITLVNSGKGLVAREGGRLRGFSIAGENRKFHRARARIDGDSILVSSPKVKEPASVRYAWASNPICNLYNREGLPAGPFRTDSWPLG